MIKELMHDPIFLALRSEPAGAEDIGTANELLETFISHREDCVGMAANMIGVRKRIIVFANSEASKDVTLMLNPEIISSSDSYETEEGCLSLLGEPRKCVRYGKIKVKYQALDLKPRIKTYSGFTAQIIQHEIDHCNGILI